MDKGRIVQELEVIRARVREIEESLIPTYEPTEDDIRAHDEAMREYEAGKLIRVK